MSAVIPVRKLRHLGTALAFQWLPKTAVHAYQLLALKRMLAFCEKRIPFYRERFHAAGVRARDLRRLADLRHFPAATRQEIVDAYPDGILSRDPRPDDVMFRTSGTSGLFMQIAYSAAAHDRLDAIYARALFVAGYRPWERIAYFWHDPRSTKRAYERLGLMRKDYLALDPDPRVQLDQLRQLRPKLIYNFPSVMLMIARMVEREHIDELRPRAIICHGEFMARETRDEIARIFGCAVWNQYGAQEFNRVGWDCSEHRNMHLDADSVVLEVLDPDGDRPLAPGEEGELVLTGLHNDLMPLVRYRIGDAGRLVEGPCGCGRALPLFEITEGRLDDILSLPDGRRIGPRVLAPRIEQVPGFDQYRVLHKQPERVEVSFVPNAAAGHDLATRIQTVVADTLGPSVMVTTKAVDRIPLSRRGKLRKIVSAVTETPGTDG